MSFKAQIEDARQVIVTALKVEAAHATDGDILETLKLEHDAIMELLSSLQDATVPAERHRLVRMITAALVSHSLAEEKVVYNAVIALPDRQAQFDGYEGTLEHEWVAKTLERIAAIRDTTSSEHKATVIVLRELVEHHIREEECNIWRDVRKHCSAHDRVRMNTLYLAEKYRAKTPIIA